MAGTFLIILCVFVDTELRSACTEPRSVAIQPRRSLDSFPRLSLYPAFSRISRRSTLRPSDVPTLRLQSSILRTLFQVPYPLSPVFATLTKTAGVWGYSSHFGSRAQSEEPLIPFLATPRKISQRADVATFKRSDAPLSPLSATLIDLPQVLQTKDLQRNVTPLDATLTKKWEGWVGPSQGGPYTSALHCDVHSGQLTSFV